MLLLKAAILNDQTLCKAQLGIFAEGLWMAWLCDIIYTLRKHLVNLCLQRQITVQLYCKYSTTEENQTEKFWVHAQRVILCY